jgi:hypothetical protein
VLVRVDATGHHVVEKASAGLPVALPHVARSTADWRYALLDDHGTTVASGELEDPRLVQTALSAPGEPAAGHSTAVLESGVYLVGIPKGVDARKLRIAATAAGTEKLGWTGTVPAGAIELSLDSP